MAGMGNWESTQIAWLDKSVSHYGIYVPSGTVLEASLCSNDPYPSKLPRKHSKLASKPAPTYIIIPFARQSSPPKGLLTPGRESQWPPRIWWKTIWGIATHLLCYRSLGTAGSILGNFSGSFVEPGLTWLSERILPPKQLHRPDSYDSMGFGHFASFSERPLHSYLGAPTVEVWNLCDLCEIYKILEFRNSWIFHFSCFVWVR